MPERQVDIDMSMHELGQRLRAAWNKEHVVPVGVLEIAKDEARNQWEIEHQIEREKEEHERQAPKIEPPKQEPNEPGLEP
jgi:hypothetical protein